MREDVLRCKSSEVETPLVRLVGRKMPVIRVEKVSLGLDLISAQTPPKLELTNTLGKSIDIITPRTDIWLLIMRNIINLMLLNECLIHRPRRILDDLVDPLAMADRLVPLG